MAKVNLPLMSVSASGKIAKSLVYFNWKGLDVVRSYVIPSNPQTTSQMTQRGYFSDAVDLFHTTSFTDLDRSALNLAATASKIVMSGFNWFMQHVVVAFRAGFSFHPLYQCSISSITKNSATVTIKCSIDKTAKLYWGTSKNFLPNVVTGNYASNTWTFSLSSLPSDTYIYFYVKNTATGEGGISGVYYFKTLAS